MIRTFFGPMQKHGDPDPLLCSVLSRAFEPDMSRVNGLSFLQFLHGVPPVQGSPVRILKDSPAGLALLAFCR